MDQLFDTAISRGSIHNQLVQGDLLGVLLAAILSLVTLLLLGIFIRFDDITWDVVKWVIVCILYIVKLRVLLSVRPHDLTSAKQTLIRLAIQLRFIRFQAP